MHDQPQRLRPLDVTGIIDTAINLYRQNFALFAGVVAVLAVPQAILSAVIAASTSTTALTASQSGNSDIHLHPSAVTGTVGPALLSFLFGIVITGALARVISARYLGEPMAVGQAYVSVGIGRFASLVAASILSILVLTIVPLVAILVIVIMVVAAFPTAVIVLSSILVVVAALLLDIKLWVHFLFIPQSMVIERYGIIGSFQRSWTLVRGSYWRVFGIMLLVLLMVSVIEGILAAVLGLALAFAPHVAIVLLSALLGILLQPFEYGAMTLLYYDLRVRKEGFDLEHLAAHHGGEAFPSGGTQPAL